MVQDCEQVPECVKSRDAAQEHLRGPRLNEAETIYDLEQQSASDLARKYVRRSWWERWERYVSDPNTRADPPGPVEESREDDEGGAKGVGVAVWDQLVKWYGVAKKATDTAASHTIHLRFCKKAHPSKYASMKPPITLPFPRTAKVSEVLSKVLKKLVLDISHLRGCYHLFEPISERDFFMNDQRTLAELGIEDNTVFCLHLLNELGRKAGKVGLVNIGNTCYMNSSLQCLLHTPELMHFFLTEEYKQNVRKDNPDGCKGRLADEFYKLMRHVWTSDYEHTNPYHFWSVLSQYYLLFAEKDQHDTAELAETVLDGLMEDCNLAKIPKPYITEMKEDADMSDQEMAEESWHYHKIRSSSFITDKFHGQYRILTRCPECRFESRRFDSFTVLHLGLPPPKRCIIIFTLIEVCGDQLPKKYAVELDSDLLVKDLYIKAAELISCSDNEPWAQLCFVLDRQKKMTFLHLSDPIARIKDHHRVLLYSYRGSQYGPCSKGRKVCFVHQKLTPVTPYSSSYCYQFSMRHEEKREFGYPFVMWLPAEDDLAFSTKKRTLQGNLDILEQTLRPFKRLHMDALHEEETKDNTLYDGETQTQTHLNEDLECNGSDVGSKQANAPSSQSLPRSDQSESHPEQDDVLSDIRLMEEHVIQDSIPDAPVDQMHHSFHDPVSRENEAISAAREAPEGVEMAVLGQPRGATLHGGGIFDSKEGYEEEHDDHMNQSCNDEDGDGEIDRDIRPIIGGEGMEENWDPEPSYVAYNAATFAAEPQPPPQVANSCSSSSVLRFGRASPSDAYSLTELGSPSRADEAQTFVIDWDSNANQFYDLQSLEFPEMDKTARGAEERKRNPAEHACIYDCLTHEFSPHPSALDEDNMWKCGGCENMVYGDKSMRLWKAPDILLIGLKRFDYCEERDRLVKLKQLVKFPLEGLDLRKFFASELGNDSIYDLYGVCNHLGDGPKIGHYTSYVKSPNGVWHKFNDTFVTEINEDKVVSQDAYLLFYRKRGLPFPDEQHILQEFKAREMARERQEWKEYVAKVYESRSTDYMQGLSDDDGHSSAFHFSKDIRTENGSSSSNEMNNENDLSNLSSHGQQGSSSTLTVATCSAFKESSSALYYGRENQATVLAGTETGQVHLAADWVTENDEASIAAWQKDYGMSGEGSGCGEVDGEHHEQPGVSGWIPHHDRGTLEAFGPDPYEPDLYDSFSSQNCEPHSHGRP